MAAHIDPIYTRTPDVQISANVANGNTTKTLESGNVHMIFAADATEGGMLQKIRIRPAGTNVATVIRIWINNGGATTGAANNALYDEITVAATTNSETASIAGTEVPMNIALPPGYRVYATLGTTVTQMAIIAIGGKY
jgi:hypothetical protein